MPRIFLAHIPDMLKNYYGERALAELRKLGDVRLNDTGRVLDAEALAQAARGCEIIVSDRQTAAPAEFFPLASDLVAFLRVAVDIRNVDVAAASAQEFWSPTRHRASSLKLPRWRSASWSIADATLRRRRPFIGLAGFPMRGWAVSLKAQRLALLAMERSGNIWPSSVSRSA